MAALPAAWTGEQLSSLGTRGCGSREQGPQARLQELAEDAQSLEAGPVGVLLQRLGLAGVARLPVPAWSLALGSSGSHLTLFSASSGNEPVAPLKLPASGTTYSGQFGSTYCTPVTMRRRVSAPNCRFTQALLSARSACIVRGAHASQALAVHLTTALNWKMGSNSLPS